MHTKSSVVLAHSVLYHQILKSCIIFKFYFIKVEQSIPSAVPCLRQPKHMCLSTLLKFIWKSIIEGCHAQNEYHSRHGSTRQQALNEGSLILQCYLSTGIAQDCMSCLSVTMYVQDLLHELWICHALHLCNWLSLKVGLTFIVEFHLLLNISVFPKASTYFIIVKLNRFET